MPGFTVCFSSLNEVTFSGRLCFTWGKYFNDYIKNGRKRTSSSKSRTPNYVGAGLQSCVIIGR